MAGPLGRHNHAGAFSNSQWLILMALAAAGALLLAEWVRWPLAQAQTGATGAGEGGVVVVSGQVTKDNYGLYLVDLRRGTICVYQYFANERRLRLMAARTYAYDTQLDSFNTSDPTPEEVADLVSRARRLKEVTTKP